MRSGLVAQRFRELNIRHVTPFGISNTIPVQLYVNDRMINMQNDDDLLMSIQRKRLDVHEIFIPPEKLPDGFDYPRSFHDYVSKNGAKLTGLPPWGFAHDVAKWSAECSAEFNRPLVLFAQAYHEDMVAGFEGLSGNDPRVIVLNPWGEPKPYVIAELDDFDAWLEWARQESIELGYIKPDDAEP